MTVHKRLLTTFALTVAILAGCDKDEPVKSYSAPKDPQVVTWTAPTGWRSRPFQRIPKKEGMAISGLFQYGNFAAGKDDSTTQITVTTLFEDAPSATDLLSNVNRWRAQLGVDPVPASALPTLVHTETANGAAIQSVDITDGSGDRRMYAAIVPREDRIWFFKMTGPSTQVEAQKEAFDAFVRSAKYLTPAAAPLTVVATDSAPSLPPAHPPIRPAAPVQQPEGSPTPNTSGLTYSLPAGWTVQPNANSVRLLTLRTANPNPADLIVSRFPGSVGTAALNLARWRNEVGLPPSNDSVAETPIPFATGAGSLLEFTGTGPNAKKSLVAKRTQGDSTWFFKLLGPAETLTRERPAFEQFLASVRFPNE